MSAYDRRKSALSLLLLSALLLSLAACAGQEGAQTSAHRLYDNKGLYSIPKDSYATLWLDVEDLPDIPFDRTTGETLAEELKPRFPMTVYDNDGLLGDAAGPAFGTVQIKSSQPYRANYRSFKLNLESESLFYGNRVITLYKCPEDFTRLSMRLALDIFATFDHIAGVNSGFVHLYLRNGGEYEDYGLYTFTENPGGRYLRNHGFDRYGELYEAKDFDFSWETWQSLDEDERNAALEYKNGEQPEKLEALLIALSEEDNFSSAFQRYFDRENYLTFLATSALLGNFKADIDSFYLYSPSDSEKWYFLPAPTDNLLHEPGERAYRIPTQQMGLGMFLDSSLHARFLSTESNRAQLAKKVKELRELLGDEMIPTLCAQYKEVLADFVGQEPDFGMLPLTVSETEARIDRLASLVEQNYQLFLQNLELPLPVTLESAEETPEGWVLHWSSPQGASAKPIVYRLKLSAEWEGTTVFFEGETEEPSILLTGIPDGAYYLHLDAYYKGAKTGQPANFFVTLEGGLREWGVCLLELWHMRGGGTE